MAQPVDMVELWRGDILECVHRGHAVICGADGSVEQVWGDAKAVVYPRSSSKMIQALPLIESGAADSFGLTTSQLALSCASHIGAAYHTDPVRAWIKDLDLTDDAFRCGAQEPTDRDARDGLIRDYASPCQYHNNCSGKHSGFLTYTKHVKAGPEYVDLTHPLQLAIKAACEEVTDEATPGYGIDGCSAPNFATTVEGMARAMANFATAGTRSGTRAAAQVRLMNAMVTHPELVSGTGKPCTEFMRATNGRAAIKGGAEGFYVAMIPSLGKGVALKIVDGAGRASEAVMAQILVRLGILDPAHPTAKRFINAPIPNWRGIVTGTLRPAAAVTRA